VAKRITKKLPVCEKAWEMLHLCEETGRFVDYEWTGKSSYPQIFYSSAGRSATNLDFLKALQAERLDKKLEAVLVVEDDLAWVEA